MSKKKSGDKLFAYLDWFRSLSDEQKKIEIKKIHDEERSRNAKGQTFHQFMENSKKIIKGDSV